MFFYNNCLQRNDQLQKYGFSDRLKFKLSHIQGRRPETYVGCDKSIIGDGENKTSAGYCRGAAYNVAAIFFKWLRVLV
jgi:hypothetical protein